MNTRFRRVLTTLLCFSVLIISCKKSDPAPLGAQTNGKLLAGEVGKSKGWKLIELSFVVGTGSAQTQTLPGCFSDNVLTFTNNDKQDYTEVEGTSSCATGSPTTIENGTWAFTIDGLTLSVAVDETFSSNGLFSPEAVIVQDANGNNFAINIGYPYPAFVVSLVETKMVLEINNKVGSSTYKYTMTFIPS